MIFIIEEENIKIEKTALIQKAEVTMIPFKQTYYISFRFYTSSKLKKFNFSCKKNYKASLSLILN